MVEYCASKNPQYYYQTIPVESLVLDQQKDGSPIEIPGCMKQHLIVFKSKQTIFRKEYLCDCASCLQFDLKIVTVKLLTMLLMLMMMVLDVKMKMTRKLVKPSTFLSLSQSLHLFLCTLEVPLSHCILFMLQEKVL